MPHSFVELHGDGFWVNNHVLLEWDAVLVHLLESEPGSHEPWLAALQGKWKRDVETQYPRGASTCLDEYLVDDARRAQIKELFGRAVGKLKEIKVESADQARRRLRELGADGYRGNDKEGAERYLRALQHLAAAFQQLVGGTLKTRDRHLEANLEITSKGPIWVKNS